MWVTISDRDEISLSDAMRLLNLRNHRALQYHIKRGRLSVRRLHYRAVMLDRNEVLALAARLNRKQAGQVRGPRTPKTQDKPTTK